MKGSTKGIILPVYAKVAMSLEGDVVSSVVVQRLYASVYEELVDVVCCKELGWSRGFGRIANDDMHPMRGRSFVARSSQIHL